MNAKHIRMTVAVVLSAGILLPAGASELYWVNAESIDRRTCPSQACGVVGFLRFKDKVEAREVKGGWARISAEYSAMCAGGKSELVESGNDDCVPKNGISKGVFAEWVPVQQLSKSPPSK